MDATTKDRIAVNLSLLPKKASSWVTAAGGALFSIWALLPAAQQQAVLEHSPLPTWLYPIVYIVIGFVASVWPQAAVAPDVVQAKLDSMAAARAASPPLSKE